MKCFLVLLAVAVCQGFPRDILERIEKPLGQLKAERDRSRERSYLQERYEPLRTEEKYNPLDEEKQLLDEKYDPVRPEEVYDSTLKTQLLDKYGPIFDKLNGILENQTPFNTPFKTPVTNPDNFLNYVTFDRKPWQQMSWVPKDSFSYKNIQDLVQFPGGDFLKDEIEKYLYPDIMYPGKDMETMELPVDMGNIKDMQDIVPIIVDKLVEKVPAYTQLIEDQHTIALLVTRDAVKVILRARMLQCPTTIMDKYYIKTVQQQLSITMKQTKVQLEDFMKTWLPRVMPQVPMYAIDQLVYSFTKDVQQHVFKDISQYVYGVGFKDIAIVSHQLYHEVKKYVENYWTGNTQTVDGLVGVVTEVIAERMVCPRQQDFTKKIKFACYDFNNLFVDRLTAQIFSRVENIIYHFQCTMFVTEDSTRDYYTRGDETLKMVLKKYIRTIVQQVPVCDNRAICWNTTSCMQSVEQISKPDQLQLKTMLRGDWTNLWTRLPGIPDSTL